MAGDDGDWTRVHRLPLLPPRARNAHKHQLGRVLIAGGSPGMTGAPWLAARAALACGAGLVTLAVPASLVHGFMARSTSTMTMGMRESPAGGLDPAGSAEFLDAARDFDVLVVGCGIGRAPETSKLLALLLAGFAGALIVDADALRIIAADGLALTGRREPAILTPHPGEMATLCGVSTAEVQADRIGIAQRTAAQRKSVVVLKGDRTVVGDGAQVFVNHSGSPKMAAAGSGDVLAGMIGAFRGRGLSPFDAAQLGVYLHGLAGDLAARERESLSADDLLAAIPAALHRFQAQNS